MKMCMKITNCRARISYVYCRKCLFVLEEDITQESTGRYNSGPSKRQASIFHFFPLRTPSCIFSKVSLVIQTSSRSTHPTLTPSFPLPKRLPCTRRNRLHRIQLLPHICSSNTLLTNLPLHQHLIGLIWNILSSLSPHTIAQWIVDCAGLSLLAFVSPSCSDIITNRGEEGWRLGQGKDVRHPSHHSSQ